MAHESSQTIIPIELVRHMCDGAISTVACSVFPLAFLVGFVLPLDDHLPHDVYWYHTDDGDRDEDGQGVT